MRRWPVRMPGDVYRSAHGLADASISRLCALRADLAVPGNPQHDQPRVRCVQLLPSQSPPALKRSRAEVFSITTSARSTIFLRTSACPSASRRSTATLDLFRAADFHQRGTPSLRGPDLRNMSPEPGVFDLDDLCSEVADQRRSERRRDHVPPARGSSDRRTDSPYSRTLNSFGAAV